MANRIQWTTPLTEEELGKIAVAADLLIDAGMEDVAELLRVAVTPMQTTAAGKPALACRICEVTEPFHLRLCPLGAIIGVRPVGRSQKPYFPDGHPNAAGVLQERPIHWSGWDWEVLPCAEAIARGERIEAAAELVTCSMCLAEIERRDH